MSYDDCPIEAQLKSDTEAAKRALDYWRLCDQLNIYQAALLIAGEDPSQHTHIEHTGTSVRPPGYEAAKNALRNALHCKTISMMVITDEIGEVVWDETLIDVYELTAWLSKRGLTTGFFSPEECLGADYLNPDHDRYAPKMAAAIHAWEFVNSDPGLLKGKTPKQAIETWLRAHANDYGLTKEDGNPNETGIQEVAKIANWDTKGGAPKTNG